MELVFCLVITLVVLLLALAYPFHLLQTDHHYLNYHSLSVLFLLWGICTAFELVLLQYAQSQLSYGDMSCPMLYDFLCTMCTSGAGPLDNLSSCALGTMATSHFISALNRDVPITIASKALYRFACSVKYHSTKNFSA